MAGNFCTQCGAQVEEEGLLFCTRCGASLVEDDDYAASPAMSGAMHSPVAGGAGGASQAASQGAFAAAATSVQAGYTMPADSFYRAATPQTGYASTARMAPNAHGVPTSPTPAAGVPARKGDDGSSAKKGALIGAAIGLVIAAIVIIVTFHPFGIGSGGSPDADSSWDQDGSAPAQAGSLDDGASTADDGAVAPAVDTAEDEPVVEDYYDDLKAYYDKMPGFDARIADCATYFNNNFTASDYGVRQAGADDAAHILSDVNAELTSLKALAVPQDNPYYADWQHMVELMEDLQHRISVIDQAWSNSLSYSDPYNYVDPIIAPLSADNVDGTNKYKKHYQDNYGNWAPTQR